MRSFVGVIGPGLPDGSSSIELFFDEGRYIFECGDGTQRLFTEAGIKLSRVKSIYLTSLSPLSIGGLLGLLITLSDAGQNDVQISAPLGLRAILTAANVFFHRPNFLSRLIEIDLLNQNNNNTKVDSSSHHEGSMHNCRSSQLPLVVPVHSNANVTISAVPIVPQHHASPKFSPSSATFFGESFCATLCYICTLAPNRGKFLPEKAISLGVQRGRLFGLLQKGKSVTNNTGDTIHPSQVMTPSSPGPRVVVLRCHDVHLVEAVIHNAALRGEYLLAEGRALLLIHFAPREVLIHPQYLEWAASLKHAQHIPIHWDIAPERLLYDAHTRDIVMMHISIDRELFPLPIFCKEEEEMKDEEHIRICAEIERRPHWTLPEFRLRYTLSPPGNIGIDRSGVPGRHLPLSESIPPRQWEGKYGAHTSNKPSSKQKEQFPVVTFLGTGGALPGKYRNVSAIFIQLGARGSLLLDCGEGTFGQLSRLQGFDEALKTLITLRVIFISHMHADHHLGLLTLLHMRDYARVKLNIDFPPVYIIGPRALRAWVNAAFCTYFTHSFVGDLGIQANNNTHVNISTTSTNTTTANSRINNDNTSGEHFPVSLAGLSAASLAQFAFFDASGLSDPQHPTSKVFTDTLGLDIGCVPVIHCPFSYGIVIHDLHTAPPWSVVYSGDTRPCPALIEAGRGCTLLIHEATFQHEMIAEAKEKMHCTTQEALAVAAQMGAHRTILTHFSQRYSRIALLDEKTVNQMKVANAIVAFDLMRISFCRLETLPNVLPVIRNAFPKELELLAQVQVDDPTKVEKTV